MPARRRDVQSVTGISDNRRLTIRLSNVNGQGVDAGVSVGFLEGDIDGSGTVTSSDVLRAKGKSGQAASASTFLSDVNLTGAVDASDPLHSAVTPPSAAGWPSRPA